jgi:hypothetical protein
MLHPRKFIFLVGASKYCAEERQSYDHRRPVDRRKTSSFGVTRTNRICTSVKSIIPSAISKSESLVIANPRQQQQ